MHLIDVGVVKSGDDGGILLKPHEGVHVVPGDKQGLDEDVLP
jgi:hypothetical protein